MKNLKTILENMTGAQKLWLGLIIIALLTGLLSLGAYLLCSQLFEKNPRFQLRHIRIDHQGNGGYWNSREAFRERQLELEKETELRGGDRLSEQNNIFDKEFSPERIRKRIMDKHAEIESIEIYRELPDTLHFKIQERTPVANIGKRQATDGIAEKYVRYLDQHGHVISARYCGPGNPTVIREDASNQIKLNQFKPGEIVGNEQVLLALRFIDDVRMGRYRGNNSGIQSNITAVDSVIIDSGKKQLFCKIQYSAGIGNPKVYFIILPFNMSREELQGKTELLCNTLLELYSSNSTSKTLNLSYEKSIVVTTDPVIGR